MTPPRTLTLDELLQLIPECPIAQLPAMAGQRPDVAYVADALQEFVGPFLREREDVPSVLSPSVVIVSAAGAVGKTTLARELARRRGAPLWDLALAKSVGQGSLDGMIHQAFGTEAASFVYTALLQGRMCLVIDALDEARVKVTESAFEDFVRDVGHEAGKSPGLKVVLLGRTQIAETSWLLLQEQGTHVSMLTIQPFDDVQAREYLDRRVSGSSPEAASAVQMYRRPFEEVRDLLLTHVRGAVLGTREGEIAEGEARAFVGYAPVLDALAVLLSTEINFAALKSSIEEQFLQVSRGRSEHRPVALLQRVVERILEREQGQKLVKNLKPLLEPLAPEGWRDWQALYRPSEQRERLLALVLGVDPTGALRPAVPPPLAQTYEDQVQVFLPEHPFLRDGRTFVNVVFESYLFARALTDGSASLSAIEARLRSPAYLPSRLLAEFYLLRRYEQSRNVPVVPPEHIGWMYDSIRSAESDDVWIDFVLEGSEPSEAQTAEAPTWADGEFILTRAGAEEEESTRLEFTTNVSPASTIGFTRYIKDATLTVPCEVALGSFGGEYEIGPRVFIACGCLRIQAEGLVVGGKVSAGRSGENSVGLEAVRCEAQLAQRPKVHCGFTVSWPGSRVFPWTEFSQDRTEPFASDAQMREAYRRFRRIVLTLRSHSKGSLARYRAKIEHQRVLQGRLGEALLKRLLDDGVLRIEGKFYHWVPDVAAQTVGVSWHQLSSRQVTEVLTRYLRNFLRAEGALK